MDFQPDMRSVFFNSLKGNNIYNMNLNLFNQNSLISNGQFNSKIQQKYKLALSILSNGIEIERANEQDYFNSILNDNKLPDKTRILLKNKMEKIFSDKGSFNYNAFINLINTILLGESQYQAVLKLEKERLGQLNSYINALKKKAHAGKLANMTNSKNENLGIIDENTLESFLEKEYLEKHTLRTFRGQFKELNSTVDNIVSQFIDKIVMSCLKTDTTNQILLNAINNGVDINTSTFVPELINNIMTQLQSGNRIAKLITATVNQNKAVLSDLNNKITNDIINNFQKIVINNQNSNFGRKTKKTAAVKEIQEENNLILKMTGENLADDILKNEEKLKHISEDYFDLNIQDSKTSEQLQKLKQLIAEGEQWAKINNTDIDKIPEEQKKAIGNAKGQLSKIARQTIENKLQIKSEDAAQAYLSKIQTALSSDIFHISGPTYSEIIDAIMVKIVSAGESFWSGPKNLKADTITITYNGINLSSSILEDLLSEEDMTQLMSQNAHTFYDSFQSHLPKSGESTNFAKGKLSWMRATYDSVQKLNQTINESQLDAEEKIKALKEVSNIMKNTIVVTETMKTFDAYYDKIGFVNGSLGPNLGTQLANFQELFNSAGVGMTNTELAWLETAIVNCSPAALGSGNKGPIEKYLSTMAGFAVFDEGSAELQMIAQTAAKFYLENSPKLLHLYKLNGIYFPGSYILSRIQENLTQTVSSMETETINNDGAHIRAGATEALIPKNEHNLQARWAKTYEAALGVTSIDVSFMSGLFNVVNQLLASFANSF